MVISLNPPVFLTWIGQSQTALLLGAGAEEATAWVSIMSGQEGWGEGGCLCNNEYNDATHK